MFDRLICAHERGDEALALVTARQLAEAQPKIEDECFRRGFRQPLQTGVAYIGMEPPLQRPYLNFLGDLPAILADLERPRQRRRTRRCVEERAFKDHQPDRTHRRAHPRPGPGGGPPMGQPGWVNLSEDPIVAALTQEGDPAVEPLLDCLEHDKRLTRSVGFGRDFFLGRTRDPGYQHREAGVAGHFARRVWRRGIGN